MLKELKPAVLMMLVLTVLTGFIYPAVITAIAQVAFRDQANGSLVVYTDVDEAGAHLAATRVSSAKALRLDVTQSLEIERALASVIEHVLAGGVEYIVTLGTTGETPTLSRDEKIRISRFTIEVVNNRVPVVIGAGGSDTREVIREIEKLPTDHAVAGRPLRAGGLERLGQGVEGDHCRALGQQQGDDLTADAAARAGDQGALPIPLVSHCSALLQNPATVSGLPPARHLGERNFGAERSRYPALRPQTPALAGRHHPAKLPQG
jgi:hypothetical protein